MSLLNTADSLRANLMLNKRFSRIIVAGLIFFLFVSFLTWHHRHGVATLLPLLADEKIPEYYPYETTSDFFPVQIDSAGKTAEELCQTFPKHILKTIQPVLKMGHGENRAKIEAQLDSVSACFDKDDLLIYSDLDETIRGHQVLDILADLPASYYVDNPDFQHYIWQREMQANGTLDHDKNATARINGWILDKYKFLPMIERAWKSKPNRDFYFFYETDTYVFWDNVFRFLQTFNPDKPLYMGSPSPGRHDVKKNVKTFFANGGPGYVLSRGAIKELLHRKTGPHGQYLDPPLTQKWLPLLKPECCGDSVVGWALWNVSVPLQGYWPLFNPHPLHGIPYSDLYWCQPVLTLHKTTPEDMPELWKWEFGRRQLSRPLTYSDLWHFRHPGHPDLIDNWDNGDWDGWDAPPEAKIDSYEACGKYCKEHDNCVQFAWQGRDKQKCIAMRSIRYGRSRSSEKIPPPENKDENGNVIPPPEDQLNKWVDYKAGWVTERVDRFIESRNCSVVQWVGPSITRIF